MAGTNWLLDWDAIGEKEYELGVDRGVIYPLQSDKTYSNGAAWNGLIAVNENPSGAEANAMWANNKKYGETMSAEQFGFGIEAYTYPDEFAECIGRKKVAAGVTVGQQKRKAFGFTYRTLIGNDVDDLDHGYIIHCAYGCRAGVSERSHNTNNDNPEAETMSWDVTTTPVVVPGCDPSAFLEINSTKCPAEKLTALEAILYGTGESQPRLPLPEEIITLVGADAVTTSSNTEETTGQE